MIQATLSGERFLYKHIPDDLTTEYAVGGKGCATNPAVCGAANLGRQACQTAYQLAQILATIIEVLPTAASSGRS